MQNTFWNQARQGARLKPQNNEVSKKNFLAFLLWVTWGNPVAIIQAIYLGRDNRAV